VSTLDVAISASNHPIWSREWEPTGECSNCFLDTANIPASRAAHRLGTKHHRSEPELPAVYYAVTSGNAAAMDVR
jgi:hypothetical protein